jgi:hypothetical protein
MKKILFTTIEAAEYLGGLKVNTMEGWREKGVGPRYLKIGRLVRYRLLDLDSYLDAHLRSSTSQTILRSAHLLDPS